MKNIIKIKFSILLLLIVCIISCKKQDLNVSTIGLMPESYTFDPTDVPGGRLEIVGDDFVTLELGQKYVDQGAFVVDTADGLVDAHGNVVDSVFNNKPVINPDLNTEGVKSAVYFFRTKSGKECSVYRNIIVYKKPSNPQTNDISGDYLNGASVHNKIVKIIDGVYYMKNVAATTSAVQNNVPALFYHTNDTSINIIPQYYMLTTATQWETLEGTAIEDRMVFLAGVNQKITYGLTPTDITITYNIYTIGSNIVHDIVSGWNKVPIKTTPIIIKKV